MKLKALYEAAVAAGMSHDPRGDQEVKDQLAETQRAFDNASGHKKKWFDLESLKNPYADTRILAGTGEEEVRGVLVGIDMGVGEVVLADRLKERGTTVDLVWAHHPSGPALSRLYDVMGMQAEMLASHGVPISTAQALTESRSREMERRLMPGNHTQSADAARLLGLAMLCTHTVADNMVGDFLEKLLAQEKPQRLRDVLDVLLELPEYKHAMTLGAGPRIISGNPNRKTGRFMLEMTGGTEGHPDIFTSLESSGVNTLVSMHLTEGHLKNAKKHHLNVVIAGHIASDTLGMNLLIDAIEQHAGETFETLDTSGFKRFSRRT